MSSLLVKKALTTCSLLEGSLLVFVCSMLVKEALAVSSLLFFASSLLVNMVLLGCHLEAVALVLPQFVDRLLPILGPVPWGLPRWNRGMAVLTQANTGTARQRCAVPLNSY